MGLDLSTACASATPYAEARRFLASLDNRWAEHVELVGDCLHQPKPLRPPYEALVRAIAFQQLHAKAGDAVLGRLIALFKDAPFSSPEELAATDPSWLRNCGFSARKVETIQGIARATIDGLVPGLDEAKCLTDEELVKRLTTLRGVGRWTVEMLLMYTLGRKDVLPVDDYGVRVGYQRLQGLVDLPKPMALRSTAEAWSPHRTAAAWYLWRVPAATAGNEPRAGAGAEAN
jgi:DNA-3-methyladenine glycosylase II